MSDRKPKGDETGGKSKVRVDDRGRTVWDGPVETGNFELVSTQVLKALLEQDDPTSRSAIENVAESNRAGLLAKNKSSGNFEVLEKSSLDDLMSTETPPVRKTAAGPKKARADFDFSPAGRTAPSKPPPTPEETAELELVDTQMLRQILDEDRVRHGKAPKYIDEAGGGANPYDRGSGRSSRQKKEPTPDAGGGFNPYDSSPRKR